MEKIKLEKEENKNLYYKNNRYIVLDMMKMDLFVTNDMKDNYIKIYNCNHTYDGLKNTLNNAIDKYEFMEKLEDREYSYEELKNFRDKGYLTEKSYNKYIDEDYEIQ